MPRCTIEFQLFAVYVSKFNRKWDASIFNTKYILQKSIFEWLFFCHLFISHVICLFFHYSFFFSLCSFLPFLFIQVKKKLIRFSFNIIEYTKTHTQITQRLMIESKIKKKQQKRLISTLLIIFDKIFDFIGKNKFYFW